MSFSREYKYCKCGQPITIEWLWNGLSHYPKFYDENENKITHCPGCGEWLTMSSLEATMKPLNYSLLPEHIREGVRLYIEDHIPPGDFLTAVIQNNLTQSFARADHINSERMFDIVRRMFDIVRFFYTEAPSQCWGSKEQMDEWLAD
jgi:hypothetical protein